MIPRSERPSSTWKSFLRNHISQLVSVDFFTVPTVTFRVLYVFLVPQHERRKVLHLNITDSRSSIWVAQQLREAFPFVNPPKYLIYYHQSRTHLALEKDAPESRSVQVPERGNIIALPQVGGLHHRYERKAA